MSQVAGSVLRATVVLGIARLGSAIALAAAFTIFAIIAGPADLGTITAFVSLVAIATTLLDAGLTTTAVRRAKRSPQSAGLIFHSLRRARLIAAAAIAPLLIGAEALLRVPVNGLLPAVLTCSQVFIVAVSGARYYEAQRSLHLGRWALSDAAGKSAAAGGILFAATQAGRTVEFALAAMALGAAVTWILARALIPAPKSPPEATATSPIALLREALVLSAALIVNTLYFRIDAVLLTSIGGVYPSGQYAFAYRFLEICLILVGVYQNNLLTSLAGREQSIVEQEVSHAWQRTAGLLLPAAVALAILAAPLTITLGDGQFNSAADLLAVLAPSLLFIGLNSVSGAALIAAHHEDATLHIAGAVLILNVVANLCLIPFFGAMGAAIATTASEAAVFVATAAVVIPKRLGYAIRIKPKRKDIYTLFAVVVLCVSFKALLPPIITLAVFGILTVVFLGLHARILTFDRLRRINLRKRSVSII